MKFTSLMKAMVWFYKYSIGLLIPPSCRFLPTCSDYALEACDEHGALVGAYLTTKRLCRCHPFTSGGIDEVPKKKLNGS